MNTLENQRYDDIINKLNRIEKRIDDIEEYLSIDKTEPIINRTEEKDDRKPYNETIKNIFYFDKCFRFLNSIKSWWRERNSINFDNFPIQNAFEKYSKYKKGLSLVEGWGSIPNEVRVLISNISEMIHLMIVMDNDKTLQFGTDEDGIIIWLEDAINTEFKFEPAYTTSKDGLFTKPNEFDYIDLLCILYDMSEIFDHVISNFIDVNIKSHKRYMDKIENYYKMIDSDVLEPLAIALSTKKNK